MARNFRYYRKEILTAVRGVKKAIDDNPTNGSPIAMLANEAGISRNILSAAFKYKYGAPIGQYRLRMRMAHAKYLLSTGRSIKEIAFSLQYSSVSSFTNAFKKYYGQSPSEWKWRRK